MDLKTLGIVFATVFLAELGDKTQLATVLFASRPSVSVLTVFVGAALALVLSTALAVGAGTLVARHVDPRILSYVAGAGFIVIGAWTMYQAANA
jgi:putative Ca2+/H+ antiporter (TMEM165/GDT1 family)